MKQNRLAVNADPFTVMRCRVIVLSITSNAVPAPRTENSSDSALGAEIERRSDRTPPPHDFATLPGSFPHESKPDFRAAVHHCRRSSRPYRGDGSFHIPPIGRHENVPAGLAGQEAPQASCSEGLNKANLLAMAGPATAPAAVQAQEASSSKKPNIVVIMGDDVGWFNIGAYHRGIMAGRTPNLDPLAAAGHALHRLLRRGKLHGRPCQLHHRPAPHPDRHDDRRPGGGHSRHAGSGADHRHRPQDARLRHRPVRQEPPGRPQRVPADRARLRRVLRLPLSPGCHGGSGPSQLSAGAEGQGRPPEHAAHLGDRRRTIRRSSRAGARSASSGSRTPARSTRIA